MNVASFVVAGVSTLASLVAVAIAILSWRASARASRSAESMAKIEQDRRHQELNPEFEVRVTRVEGWAEHQAQMEVVFSGPGGAISLDQVTIAVRDDRKPGGRSPDPDRQAAIEAHVWGPWRFAPGVSEADRDGRVVPLGAMTHGDRRQFQIERTAPLPPEQQGDAQAWRDRYKTSKILVELRCEAKGYRPWVVPKEVEQPPEPRSKRMIAF